ncbi:MAG TPA: lamin tail domain-containing protein [Polyangiales bacterium]|nr:lamin tail domain-containing protein [Polyangiales bacterium]
MRLGLSLVVVLVCLGTACLDTRPDKPGPSAGRDAAFAAWDAGAGTQKPPLAQPTSAGTSSAKAGAIAPQRVKALQPSTAGGGGRSEPQPPLAAAAGSGGIASPAPALPAPGRVGDVIITELMIDPQALPDADGEWIELFNTTDTELELRECQLDDGGKSPHPLSAALRIAKAAYFTVARSAAPGFKPDATLSVSLTNSADSVALVCHGIEIDRVNYDRAAEFVLKPGVSLSLDPSMLDNNDRASSWCAGRDAYNTDLGSPGRENPSCADPAEEDAESSAEPEDPDAGADSD